MNQIIDNATFRAWVLKYAAQHKLTYEEVYKKVGEIISPSRPFSSYTVKGWASETNPKPLTARNAALITAAIERGEL
jgi:hypothetical protein